MNLFNFHKKKHSRQSSSGNSYPLLSAANCGRNSSCYIPVDYSSLETDDTRQYHTNNNAYDNDYTNDNNDEYSGKIREEGFTPPNLRRPSSWGIKGEIQPADVEELNAAMRNRNRNRYNNRYNSSYNNNNNNSFYKFSTSNISYQDVYGADSGPITTAQSENHLNALRAYYRSTNEGRVTIDGEIVYHTPPQQQQQQQQRFTATTQRLSAASGRRVLRGHKRAVTALSLMLSESNVLALSGSEDKEILVWSLLTGEHMATFRGHDAKVSSIVTLQVDGCEPVAVSASWDETVRIWPMRELLINTAATTYNSAATVTNNITEAETTTATAAVLLPKKLEGHHSRVFSLAIVHVHGVIPLVASGSADNTIRLWALPDGTPMHVLQDVREVTWNLCLYAINVPAARRNNNNNNNNNCSNNNNNSSNSSSSSYDAVLSGPVIISGCKNNCIRVWTLPPAAFGVSQLEFDQCTNNYYNNNYNTNNNDDDDDDDTLSDTEVNPGDLKLANLKNNHHSSHPHHRQQQQQNKQQDVSRGFSTNPRFGVGSVQLQRQQGYLLIPHPSRVHSLTAYECSSNSNSGSNVFIATVCRDTSVRIWTIQGMFVKTLKGNQSPLRCITSYNNDANAAIADTEAAEEQHSSSSSSGINGTSSSNSSSCNISSNSNGSSNSSSSSGNSSSGNSSSGAVIVGTGDSGEIRMWVHSTGELFKVFHGHSDEASVVNILPLRIHSVAPVTSNNSSSNGSSSSGVENSSKSGISSYGNFTASPSARFSAATSPSVPYIATAAATSTPIAAAAAAGVTAAAASVDAGKINYFVVSGSRDCTVRSWLINDEENLRVLRHGSQVRINAMDVFVGEETYVLTGADDGCLRCWAISHSQSQQQHQEQQQQQQQQFQQGNARDVKLWENKSHNGRVLALAIYSPLEFLQLQRLESSTATTTTTGVATSTSTTTDADALFGRAFIVSGCRLGHVVMSDLRSGEVITRLEDLQDIAINTIVVYSGSWRTAASKTALPSALDCIDPFAAFACEDHVIRVYSLRSMQSLFVLTDHHYDVTSLTLHVHKRSLDKSSNNSSINNNSSSNNKNNSGNSNNSSSNNNHHSGSGSDSREEMKEESAVEDVSSLEVLTAKLNAHKQRLAMGGSSEVITTVTTTAATTTAVAAAARTVSIEDSDDVLLISSGFDHVLRLWSFQHGSQVLSSSSNTHITALATVSLPVVGAVLAAGDSEGALRLWSLSAPFKLLQQKSSQGDEVQSLSAVTVEGLYCVLVAGHCDTSVSIWKLPDLQRVTVLEGHTDEVTAVNAFHAGGTIPAAASASKDGSVRIVMDFLDFFPDAALVKSMFQRDLSGDSSFYHNAPLPQQQQQQQQQQPTRWPRIREAALRLGADQFFNICFYLFRTAITVGRSDFLVEFLPLTRTGLVNSHNTALVGEANSLLKVAIILNHVTAIQVIVDCWCRFFSEPPVSDQDILYDINFPDLNATFNLLVDDHAAAYERLVCSIKPVPVRYNNLHSHKRFVCFDRDTRQMKLDKVPVSKIKSADELFYFFPVPYFATADVLKRFEKVCTAQDSVAIYNSEVAKMVLLYCWETCGYKAHFYSFLFYGFYTFIITVEVLTFVDWRRSNRGLVYLLHLLQLLFTGCYAYAEVQQFRGDHDWYFRHFWNYIDLAVIIGNGTGVLLRFSSGEETAASAVVFSITIILVWFNLLQYLRAYEVTGPLVSMIMQIARDIRYLLLVLFLVLIGFSQAFWLLAQDTDSGFSEYKTSLLLSYAFMLGQYDPLEFASAKFSGFATLLSAVYMLIVSILLLNLMIALMGDSYAAVQSKGLAQWRLEKSKICIENVGSSYSQQRLERKRGTDSDFDVIYLQLLVDDVPSDARPDMRAQYLANAESLATAGATAATSCTTAATVAGAGQLPSQTQSQQQQQQLQQVLARVESEVSSVGRKQAAVDRRLQSLEERMESMMMKIMTKLAEIENPTD